MLICSFVTHSQWYFQVLYCLYAFRNWEKSHKIKCKTLSNHQRIRSQWFILFRIDFYFLSEPQVGNSKASDCSFLSKREIEDKSYFSFIFCPETQVFLSSFLCHGGFFFSLMLKCLVFIPDFVVYHNPTSVIILVMNAANPEVWCISFFLGKLIFIYFLLFICAYNVRVIFPPLLSPLFFPPVPSRSLPTPPPHYQAETILLLSLILLKREYKQ
jgi:hypothetical protein